MIAATAREVPWRPPETFYEGLCALWFLHEASASLDGVVIYVLGRIDHLLGGLLERDLSAGRLSEGTSRKPRCQYAGSPGWLQSRHSD